MKIEKIMEAQKYQRYKSLMFLGEGQYSTKESVGDLMERYDYMYLDVCDELPEGIIEEVHQRGSEAVKNFFQKLIYSTKVIVVKNLDILLSILSEKEIINFIEGFKKDIYKPFGSDILMIFILPKIERFRKLRIENEDNKISRIINIEEIEY